MTAASTRNQIARAALAQVVIVDRTTPAEPGAVTKSYAIADAVIAALGASSFTRDNMAAAAVLALADFKRSGNTWDDAAIATAATSIADLMVASSSGPDVPPGDVTGDANSILFEDPAGGSAITDPNLAAAPLDPFGRPQVWDHRVRAGLGSVLREGAWQADGDATSQTTEGAVLYGPNALGLGPDATQGGYFRAKPTRFGVAQIIPGVNGGALYYAIRLDTDTTNGIQLQDDFAIEQFHVDRVTGTVRIGSPDATHGGTGGLFVNQSGPLGGSTAPVQMSQVTKSNAIRLAQYGAIAATPNVSFFRSRGATIGALASCNTGDALLNFTASGVTADNASVPLAIVLDAVIPAANGLFAQSISPDFRIQIARDLINSRRVVWTVQGFTGSLIMGAHAPAATQGAQIKIDETSSNAMQGVAILGVGGFVNVANTLITANTRISLTWQDGGPPPTAPAVVAARTPGTGFQIASLNTADLGTHCFWQLWEPAP